MCAASGDVEHSMVIRRELDADPLPESGRIRTKVYGDIEDRSPRAADRLGLLMGRDLIVQSTQRGFLRGVSYVDLNDMRIQAVSGEFVLAP